MVYNETTKGIMVFKNREIKVTMDKKSKDQVTETPNDTEMFDHKVKVIFRKIERLGVIVFAGVCAYVLLDTVRQTEVEKIKNSSD
jgi:hypothetical protein